MVIRSLQLKDYRNYDDLYMEFDDNVNILFGDNAQGKTNILEAIYLGSTTRSHRGNKDRELIHLGREESHIRIEMRREEIGHRIDIHLKRNKAKGAAIDGMPIRKSSELVGFMNVVFFSPEDLSMVKNGPGERRRFVDMELCQLDKVYLNFLSGYNRTVQQRNNLLKQISFKPSLMDTLSIWDEQLVQYGNQVIEGRKKFITCLNDVIRDIHYQLSGEKEEIHIQYVPSVDKDEFLTKLEQGRERDIALKTTNTGPHRDDLVFYINDLDIRRFGSQGQVRSATLSLKLAEIELVKRMTGHKPILLLDDVLSELDRTRQKQLLNGIQDIQVIITCTGMEEFIRDRLKINKVYHVSEGKVTITE
ncbi:DNA replication/repair protein RecF [Anaerolentibacter hominis]|uniref:DNA replication/repair protein RecF n=1 Tax=Anaerolentibacter hominis TaxID=3079009 RepID=UPI0031B8ADFC